MRKQFNDSEVFINEEIEFSIGNKDYFWVGSYEVVSYGEESDWEYAGDSETIVNILSTHQLCYWDEDLEQTIDVIPTQEIIETIVESIFNRL